ncbi:MAG: hypothetical protein J6U10_07520 [Lachnospiraceae bacterium]|nr:hypothetical protein [Lachnospiraceae bacterium]
MKRSAIITAVIFMAICLAGCGLSDIKLFQKNTEEKVYSENRLLSVNGIESDYREALLYLLSAKESAEKLYGEGIWELKLDEAGTTYGALRKKQVLEEFIELKIICANAGEYEIELYEEENRDIAEYTREFIEKAGRENLLKYNISEPVVKTLYTNNIIANKIYEAVTLSVDTNVPDAEARRGKYQYIFKSKFKETESGTSVPLTEEENTTLREQVQKLRNQAVEKKDFLSFALLNTEAKEVEVYAGAGFFNEASELVMALSDGEFSPVLETGDGYYIVKCIKAFDEEATVANREKIVLARQEARFEELLEKWKANAQVETDYKKWESLNP